MRRFVFSTCALALALCPTAKADFDLTPTPHEYVGEGIKYQELLFKHDKRQVSYMPPARWSWRSAAGLLVLTPPDKTQAEAAIAQAPLLAPQTLDEACMKELVQRALQSVPPGIQNVKVVQQEQNPIPINGNPTWEIVISYEAYGQLFQKSMLFLHLPDTELVFRLTARETDFAALHNAFRKSLYSWQWL